MHNSEKKVVVTGGEGYIGSKLVAKLNAVSYDTKSNHDILDYLDAASIFYDADLIYHLAAAVGKLASQQNRARAFQVNVLGTLNVLEACRKYDVKKLVNVSTSEVLGDPVYLPTDEKHPCNPKTTYGISKLAAEQLCMEYHRSYGLNVVIARPFMVYGEDDFRKLEYASAVSKFIHAALIGEKPLVYEGCSRAWLHVDDCVDAFLLLGEKADFGVYDVASPPGESLSMIRLACRILELCGRSYKPEVCAAPVSDTKVKQASGAKMWLSFGWRPKHRLLADLPLMIEAYMKGGC